MQQDLRTPEQRNRDRFTMRGAITIQYGENRTGPFAEVEYFNAPATKLASIKVAANTYHDASTVQRIFDYARDKAFRSAF